MTCLNKKGILNALQGVGLKKIDAELYLFLVQNDQATASQIAEALKADKTRIYRSVKSLEHRKMLIVTNGLPNTYSAAPISEVLDDLIEANKEDAKRIEKNRNRFLSEWKKLA